MTTDYRALCAELLAWAEKTSSHYYKQADVLLRARAALTKAVPSAKRERSRISIDEMCEILRSLEIKATEYTDCTILYEVTFDQLRAICDTRAADLLQRQYLQPVPVSERLPGEGDCTAQGWCWVFYQGFATWTLEPPLGQDGKHTGYTHWLPFHALPLPKQEVSE